MEKVKADGKIECQAVGVEFTNSMDNRNKENSRRGAVRINQLDLLNTIETSNLEGLSITPQNDDEIVTDSEDDE